MACVSSRRDQPSFLGDQPAGSVRQLADCRRGRWHRSRDLHGSYRLHCMDGAAAADPHHEWRGAVPEPHARSAEHRRITDHSRATDATCVTKLGKYSRNAAVACDVWHIQYGDRLHAIAEREYEPQGQGHLRQRLAAGWDHVCDVQRRHVPRRRTQADAAQ